MEQAATLWDSSESEIEPETPQVKRHEMESFDVSWRYECGNGHTFLMNYYDVMHYTDKDALPCKCGWPAGITMAKEQPQ